MSRAASIDRSHTGPPLLTALPCCGDPASEGVAPVSGPSQTRPRGASAPGEEGAPQCFLPSFNKGVARTLISIFTFVYVVLYSHWKATAT